MLKLLLLLLLALNGAWAQSSGQERLAEYERLDAAARNGGEEDPDAVRARIQQIREEADIDYILKDVSQLLAESREGTERVRDIVRDLRSYARAADEKPELADINAGIEAALKIVWNELKYKCEVHKQLAPLPALRCRLVELEQELCEVRKTIAANEPSVRETFARFAAALKYKLGKKFS